MEFLTTVIIYHILIGILVFGTFMINLSLPRDRVVRNFTWLLALSGCSFIIGVTIIILNKYGYIAPPTSLDYIRIWMGVISQLYIQFFIYTLLFEKWTARKWSAIQSVPFVLVIGAVQLCDKVGLLSPVMARFFEVVIIAMQFCCGLIIALFCLKLIPLYQGYIERTESNDARNLVWVKEVCYLLLSLLIVYTIGSLYPTFITYLCYFAVAIWSFSRVIILMLQNYAGDYNINNDLYDEIGIKWSIRKSWHIPQEAPTQHCATHDKLLFDTIETWIIDSCAYSNPDFSFKSISTQFPTLSYNEYDDLLQEYCGLNFQAYIRNLRIDQAIEILNDPNAKLQLKIIANTVGFDSGSSFSRAFRAAKGITPSEWKANSTTLL